MCSFKKSNVKVTVSDVINFTDSENVYIFDKVSGIYFDIKNGEFNMSLPAEVEMPIVLK